MRTFRILILLALSVLGTAHLPSAAATYSAARVAPADEYFGRLKMSILGIRNQLRDLRVRLAYSPERGADVLGSATMVEDALRDWEHKYPGDPWLAKSVYQLTSLYASIHTAEGRQRASHTLEWLLARYGHTAYGSRARARIEPQVGLR